MRVITWNVARRSSRLAEQAAALAGREPDVVALQEVTDATLPLWRAVLERIGLPHVRASLDSADPCRAPASRRRTGVLLGSSAALRGPSATLPVPWVETAVAALVDAGVGPVEIHCLHVPNAANGWVKASTLQAVRAGLQLAPTLARVVCGDLNTPRRELESGEVVSFARDSRGRLRRGRTRIAPSTATDRASRAGRGSASRGMEAAGASITCSARPSCGQRPVSTTTPGATRA